MDPLSISASIAGLCIAAVHVSHLLRNLVDNAGQAPRSARNTLMETTGIYVCLNQLDSFLSGRQEATRSRRSLIMIEQVIIILTDSVSIFSELEQVLETLKGDGPMRAIDVVRWSLKEKTISKLLARLKESKTSLNLMLTILTCTSMEHAEESTRNLSKGIQLLLRSNLNMSRRLRNMERMHPALVASSCASSTSSIVDFPMIQANNQSMINFEKDLETSPAYKRAGFNRLRNSERSSTMSPGPSFMSGLSLCDVSNVSAVVLPISSSELWNHHRYTTVKRAEVTTLDAWYNPPSTKSAFIRTAYFNGQYTNQYAQPKFKGHLIYRRFNVTARYVSPVFTEGAVILPQIREDVPVQKAEPEELEAGAVAELDDSTDASGTIESNDQEGVAELPACHSRAEQPRWLLWPADDAARWRQSVLRLLDTTYTRDHDQLPLHVQ